MSPTSLTSRQLEVLGAIIATGGPAKCAAARLGISTSTVRNTLTQIRERLDVRSTEQAIYLAVLSGDLVGLEIERPGQFSP